MRASKPALWLFILIVFYAVAQLLWYWQTPLGQMPVLDGQENLLIAEKLSDGTLEREPFYRAILYPALLAALPIHWMVLGLICHIACAIFAYRISERIWKNRIGALITAALIGFNPVLLHFAFDPLDIVFATTLFLLAIDLLTPISSTETPNAKRLSAAGCLIALATLARPHFLAVLLPALSFAAIVAIVRPRARKPASAFAIASLLPLVLFGFYQQNRSGSFAILPTQGAYNLWASNRPGANGLYLTQSLNFHYIGEHQNPTKLESEALYRQETGEAGTIADRNAYWRSKAIDHMTGNPVQWLSLMGFKSYAWLNNFEQYNNKTYAFHKDQSPWLRYNPIGWGLLFVAAATSFPLLISKRRNAGAAGVVLFVSYSGAALLYMASARFRLPMIPLLAIAAGGLPLLFGQWKSLAQSTRTAIIALGVVATIVAFSRFGSVSSTKTYTQDMMLLADASSRIGADHLAFQWADRTLEQDPNRSDARRLRLLSYYNLASRGIDASTGKTWSAFENDLQAIPQSDPYIEFAKGVCLWNLGQYQHASEVWRQSFQRHNWNAAASLAAIIVTDSTLPPAIPGYPPNLSQPDPLLLYALHLDKGRFLRERIGFAFEGSPELYASIERSLQRVLPQKD